MKTYLKVVGTIVVTYLFIKAILWSLEIEVYGVPQLGILSIFAYPPLFYFAWKEEINSVFKKFKK